MAEEKTTTNVETPVLAKSGDVDLTAMNDAWLQQGLETALGDALDPQQDERVEMSQDTQADDANGDVSEKTDESGTVPDESAKQSTGIDAALQFLEDNNPDLANAVRAQIRDNNALRGRVSGVEDRIEVAVQEAVSAALGESASSADQPVANSEQYSADEIEQAKKVLRDELGVVFKEDVEQEREMTSRQQYLDDAMARGVEKYGEMFGRKEGDTVVLSEAAQARVNEEWNRIAQHGTVTIEDLFVVSHHDEIVKDAFERGKAEGQKLINNRRTALSRAATANTSAPALGDINIRGETGKDSDSLRAVTRRAAALAKEKLGL